MCAAMRRARIWWRFWRALREAHPPPPRPHHVPSAPPLAGRGFHTWRPWSPTGSPLPRPRPPPRQLLLPPQWMRPAPQRIPRLRSLRGPAPPTFHRRRPLPPPHLSCLLGSSPPASRQLPLLPPPPPPPPPPCLRQPRLPHHHTSCRPDGHPPPSYGWLPRPPQRCRPRHGDGAS